MRNIERFPSEQMYPYLSLVERKVTEFYHNIDRRRYLVWSKWLIFITFSRQLLVSLLQFLTLFLQYSCCLNVQYWQYGEWRICRSSISVQRLLASQVGGGRGPKCHNNRDIIHYRSLACSSHHIAHNIVHFLSIYWNRYSSHIRTYILLVERPKVLFNPFLI